MAGTGSESQHTARKITLVVLGALVAGTIFLLPRFVSDPWVAGDEDLPAVPEPASTTVAPSTAAELTRFRQDSQGVLAEIMAMRDRLQESGVEHWADVEFRQARQRVEAGDERYSYGEYEASLEEYKQARELLGELEELGRQKLGEATQEAAAAIESLNVPVAVASIELAGMIAAEDPGVQTLAARIEVLPQVVDHITAGDNAFSRDRFQEARSSYQKAVTLDPRHRRAAESLERAGREVTASAFRGHMSRGFAALERGAFDAARAAFGDAGKVYPGNPAVQQALDQVDNRETGNYVDRELARVAGLEATEQWREAVKVYEILLQRDPSLADVRVRLIPARVRADLDERLEGFIAEPLKMSSESEFRAGQAALADARGIPSPGPRLSGQIEQLDELLKLANSPVDVVIRSDNQTHVVLFRVADLGRFEQRSLQLRPGRYVASGTRSGFRDVRVEFTVTGREKQEQIVVRCEEPVG